jgi:methionyl-tRNA formyltransferase
VDRLATGGVAETPQDDSAATYAPLLTKADGAIDWSQSAAAVHNLVRGLHPWPHAYSFVSGRRLIIHRTSLVDRVASGAPGTILTSDGERLRVATGSGPLELRVVQIEGKRPMDVRDFLAGHPLVPGDRFTAQA